MLYEVITLPGDGVERIAVGMDIRHDREPHAVFRPFAADRSRATSRRETRQAPAAEDAPKSSGRMRRILFREEYSRTSSIRITSYNVCYTKLLRNPDGWSSYP